MYESIVFVAASLLIHTERILDLPSAVDRLLKISDEDG